MKKILIPIGMLLITHSAYAQLTQRENYIQSRSYLDYDMAGNPVKTSETVQYFDGLGRPKQIVNVKASPQQKDVVTHIEYDQFGRQIKEYLPVPQSGTLNGAIIPNPLSNAPSSPYGSEKIYSEKILENSPLDKVLQQIQTGNDWGSKPIKFDYETNIDGEVKKYVATFNYLTFEANIVLSGTYKGSQLYKNTVTDQDGNKTIEFKNGKGQVLLARKVISETENADTYYVYNNYQQLAYVIPPLASISSVIDEITLNNLCYQYKYDERKRLVEKKVPGKGWEYMVYDKSDRLVLTQDANLRTKGQWLFTKYDQFSRPIYTGILDSSPGRIQQKNVIEGHGTNYETKSASSWNNSGMDVFYTNNGAYPTANFKLLSVNYYDTYPSYSFNPPFPSTIQGIETLKETVSAEGRSTKGLPVMSLIKNIEDDNWTKNYNYYDIKGRIIGSYSINHLGGYTKKESKLDFTGITQTVIIRHKRLETDTEKIITENFEYDHQNRLLFHRHQVNANPVEILAQNKYNELSQLESKKVGGIDISNPLQTIDYKYNIKGRLTKINDPSNLNGKLFGYEIKYNQPINNTISPGRFNGNIAEIDWRNSSEDILKRYNYEYDRLNRLKNGFYSEPNATNPANGNFDEYLTYDLNGNINTLQRKAPPVSGQTSALVDNLEYKYTGNRLNQVIESAMNDTGYEGGNNMIDYDVNGNMTTMKDKGINSIVYNYFNLPNSYSIENKSFGLTTYIGLKYLYRADGTKLRKVYSSRPVRGLTNYTTTDYLDGFQYSYREGGGICITCRTESAFEEQAYGSLGKIFPDLGEKPTWKLEFVPTSEGFYSFTENRYIYQYKDHLGNARVSFAKNSAGVLEVTDTNNYYPFGLNHISGMFGLSNFGALYSYKYNGKELQETGMYDYGARMYMPDLGRWGVIDPKSQQTHEIYSYVWNNPIQFTDPTGMMAETFGVSDDWVRDNETQELRWEESAIDQSTSPAGTTYVGETFQEGNLYYAADGYVYDDSAAGKGKAIEDGRVHDVGDVIITKTNLWNSPFARFLVPDRFGITQGGSVGGGAEIGTSMGLEVITRGKDAGIYFDPGNTLSLGVAFGAGGEGNLSFFSSSFTGKVSDMSLNSVVGTEAYVNGSLVDVVGVTASVAVSFDPNPNNGPVSGRWVTRSVGVAAGAKGSVGAGVTISNTRVGVGFDGKIRIADYTGAVTGKGSY